MIYKVSYVVVDRSHPGAIVNEESVPQPGDLVEIGDRVFEVIDATEMMMPRGEFEFWNVAVKPADPEKSKSKKKKFGNKKS